MSVDINSNNSKLLAENVLKRIQEYRDPKLNVSPYLDATLEVTDNGNYIMDTDFSNVATFAGKPEELHKKLKQLTGVVETALFIDMVAFALCVCGDEVKVIEK